ncbi:GDP-mannose-dependent alpha-(1-6)-phosphatidylinositol monomannoside mannosyltransferase [Candidatus Brocadiaceae bacterium B188]|nr:glycosyltransferase family 4 protein [Candidatus Brocadia sapporoensis]RZV56404.1 MAG: glycosyltransferase [Candidatus Brocadia sp. BROELEC01]TWU52583.1 GDP-mannose-dependent alpha-(1-6)-phosphatidylinositol monomannoside mannosyltransferase [Candidatus Brocadiaceae bacterium B188]
MNSVKRNNNIIRIFVIGVRGFPGVQGGVEKHSEEQYKRLARNTDLDITVLAIDKYCNTQITRWENVNFRYLKSINSKNLEKLYYGLKASMYSILKKPDIVHFQGLNSAIYIPLVKLFGIKTIFTQGSMDYLYPKWGKIAKFILKISEKASLRADKIIAVSKIIYDHLRKYSDKVVLVYNGVNINHMVVSQDEEKSILTKYGLRKQGYVFFVGRLTKEKAIEDLIKAFIQLDNNDFKLVIAGGSEYTEKYSSMIKNIAKDASNILFTGFITGSELQILFSNAKLFVLPSRHEGLSNALLEAISYGIEILASDIEANLQINLNKNNFFKMGDVEDLKSKMNCLLHAEITEKEKLRRMEMLKANFDWDETSKKMYALYKEIVQK